MSALTEALEQISYYAKRCYQPPDGYQLEDDEPNDWQPGLTFEELEEKVKDLPFRLSKEVYELYQWRNGCWSYMPSNLEHHWGTYYTKFLSDLLVFLPLEEAVRFWKQATSDNLAYLENNNDLVFPLFSNENFYFCVTGDVEQKETSAIICDTWLWKTENYKIIAPSLTNMMLAQAECLALELDGIYNYDYKAICHKYDCKGLPF